MVAMHSPMRIAPPGGECRILNADDTIKPVANLKHSKRLFLNNFSQTRGTCSEGLPQVPAIGDGIDIEYLSPVPPNLGLACIRYIFLLYTI